MTIFMGVPPVLNTFNSKIGPERADVNQIFERVRKEGRGQGAEGRAQKKKHVIPSVEIVRSLDRGRERP
jgi:hypothetical protein